MSGAPAPATVPGPALTASLGRVAFLTNILPPYRLPALRSLAQRCDAVRIFVSTIAEPNRSWNQEWSDFDVIVNTTITLAGRWHHPRGFVDPLFVHLPLDTLQQLWRFRPDAILSGEMGFRTLSAAIYRRLRRHCRLLVWADVSESTEQGRGPLRALARRVLSRAADGFIVNGKSGARYLRRLGVRDERIFGIPYATDLQRFAPADAPRDRNSARRLLYAGQLSERKGLRPFLAALAEWCRLHEREEIVFTLVGEGPLLATLQKEPVPPNLQLRFHGAVPYEDMPAIYAQAGILVLPTLADTWGLVVNEAMAAGLPVLGSVFSPAVEELVEDGVSGWTFRPDQEQSLANAIERCFETAEPNLRNMRRDATASAARFSPERVAVMIEKAIHQCRPRAGVKAKGGAL